MGTRTLSPNYTHVSVINDVTDSLALRPEVNPILGLYDFAGNRDKEASLRLVLLTDKVLNPVQNIHLDNGNIAKKDAYLYSVRQRDECVYSFYASAKDAITGFEKHFNITAPHNNSECYATIAAECIKLSNSPASQKYLLIYSDLMENGTILNTYSRKGQNLITNQPEKVIKIFLKAKPIPQDLRGINIYFMYRPITRMQDESFSKMVVIYRQILEARGAHVEVKANNSF